MRNVPTPLVRPTDVLNPFKLSALSLYSTRVFSEASTQLFGLSKGKGCSRGCEYDRTNAARLPWETDGAYGGWGGSEHFETAAGASRTPVVFVHGNTRDACDWRSHADYLLDRGYVGDELWAISFGSSTTTHPEMVEQLDAFVSRVREYTGTDAVSVAAHSLGATGVRYWMDQRDRYEWIESFASIAGANHGVSFTSGMREADSLGDRAEPLQFVGSDRARDPSQPLAELNAGTETPGDVTYYTIRGAYDFYFWRDLSSPALDGAERNVRLATDHDGTRTSSRTKRLLYRWFAT